MGAFIFTLGIQYHLELSCLSSSLIEGPGSPWISALVLIFHFWVWAPRKHCCV